jgi:hypothetical protein
MTKTRKKDDLNFVLSPPPAGVFVMKKSFAIIYKEITIKRLNMYQFISRVVFAVCPKR